MAEERYPSIGVMMRGVTGVTGTGGTSDQAGMLVKLDEGGRLPSDVMPFNASDLNPDNPTGRLSILWDDVKGEPNGLLKKFEGFGDSVNAVTEFAAIIAESDAVNRLVAVETKVGNSSSGLVKDVDGLKTTVGGSGSGLVKDVAGLKTAVGATGTGLTGRVETLEGWKTSANNTLSGLESSVNNGDTGLLKRTTDLETKVGEASSGLVKDVNDLKSTTGTGENGLGKRVGDLETWKTGASSSISSLTGTVGNNSTGLVKAAADLRVDVGLPKTGETAGTGLTGRVEVLEGKVQAIESTLNGGTSQASALMRRDADGSGIVSDIAKLKTDVSALQAKVDTFPPVEDLSSLSELERRVSALEELLDVGSNEFIERGAYMQLVYSLQKSYEMIGELQNIVGVLYDRIVEGSVPVPFRKPEDGRLPDPPSAATLGAVYLVPRGDGVSSEDDRYDEYVTLMEGEGDSRTYRWERIGSHSEAVSGG